MANEIQYLVFDVESVADGKLIAAIRYPGESLSPNEAIQRYRTELFEKSGSDFIPYTFQVPVSIVVAKIDSTFHLRDLVALDEPQFRSHVMTENFWRGWEVYDRPTLVSFNGRSFDMPLLELAAFRFGISIPRWMDHQGPNYNQPRYRYNPAAHLDLHDTLTNFGASRFHGGLNLAANLLGKPGKMDVQGDMVQDLFDQEQFSRINDYCRCDVLDTYFVLLRTFVMMGRLTLDDEQAIIREAKQWLNDHAEKSEACQAYLDHWGDWTNPWSGEEAR